jgi:hypothetical protein
MVSGLKEVHPLVEHSVHQPVLIRQPPGPEIRPKVLQRFGSSDALKGVP